MWSRFAFFRFFSVLVLLSLLLLPLHAGAQTDPARFLPSPLPHADTACPRGYALTDAQCAPVRVPAHAFLDFTGHDWECERGYRRVENQCVAVDLPEHAYLDYFGHDWECERGYRRAGDQCVAIKLPAHAYLDYTGHDWVCEPGYERVGQACDVIAAAASRASVTRMVAPVLPSPEAKETIRQLQQQLKQAGYDPGPIDGLLGPKTLAALQQYLHSQKRNLVQAAPIRPGPNHGQQG